MEEITRIIREKKFKDDASSTLSSTLDSVGSLSYIERMSDNNGLKRKRPEGSVKRYVRDENHLTYTQRVTTSDYAWKKLWFDPLGREVTSKVDLLELERMLEEKKGTHL